jgi:DNA-binding FrmR family transcriptional regulator
VTPENENDVGNILLRLKRIEGQVRGLQRMIEKGRKCEEVITQIMAVRAALDQVGVAAVNRYAAECMPEASEEARASLKHAIELLLKLPLSCPLQQPPVSCQELQDPAHEEVR